MKILIVTPHFWPENFRINDFAEQFIDREHEVTVLTQIPNYPKGKFFEGYGFINKRTEVYKNIKIHRIPVIPRGNGSNFMISLNYLSYIFFSLFSIIKFYKKKYDLIFVFEPSPITVAIPAIVLRRLLKIPLFLWVLDLWPESVEAAGNLKTKIIPKFLLPIVKFIYKQSDLIMVSSRGFIKSINDKGIDSNKIIYFPQWSEEIFEMRAFEKKIKEDNYFLPEGFILMFAGNIGEAQDFPAVLDAAIKLKSFKDIHWVIIGSGSREEWLIEAIKTNDLEENFHLFGQHPIEDMPQLYSKSDALFITLKNDHIFSLTVPAKLQTYLASGKPILTMVDGETSNIVKESNSGLVADSGNSDAFSKNILKMYQMEKSDLKKFGNNGFNYYKKNFRSSILIKKAEDIFESMITDR